MADVVTLSCPRCGGRLEIKSGVNRFACGYCGNEHIVHREGGIVSLEAVGESLQKIEVSTDRTALELTLARLEKELNNLKVQESNAINEVDSLRRKISDESVPIKLGILDIVMALLACGFFIALGGPVHGLDIVSVLREYPNAIWVSLTYTFLKVLSYAIRKSRVSNELEPRLNKANSQASDIQQLVHKTKQERDSILAKLANV